MKSSTNLLRNGLMAGIVGALALVVALFVGCAPAGVSGGYTITDGGIDVSGPTLTVTLECDPDTGYEWNESLSGNGLEFDGVEHHSDADNPEGSPDSVAYDTFTFTGTGEGTQTITFTYTAPSDPGSTVKTVTLETKTNGSGQFTAADAVASDGSKGSLKG